MQIWPAANKKTSDLLADFGSSIKLGISSQAAAAALLRYGKNTGARDTRPLWFVVLKRQFSSPFIYLLLAAAFISLLLGETIGTGFIIVFVCVNTGLGFFQEYRSEQTALLLQSYIQSKARVMRDGQEIELDQENVVPGDIVMLKPGDIIPADVRFLTCDNFEVDESLLSGESQTIQKTSKTLRQEVTHIYDAQNLGFGGTVVIGGTAQALVVSTGQDMVAHKIGALVVQTEHVSGFQKNLAKFSRFILQLILITLLCVIVANLVLKAGRVSLPELLVFAIALAISVVPEALPVVTTFSLSQGARALSRKHVIVKRLSAIEDLGGIEVLCTDKTGTLTENEMTVGDIYMLDGTDPVQAGALVAATADQAQGVNPFDAALLSAAGKKGKQASKNRTRLFEIPFTPQRRYETVAVREGTGAHVILRGAPEAVLAHCRHISPEYRTTIDDWMKRVGDQGRRVLAVAGKHVKTVGPALKSRLETGITLYGLISFVDPVKPSTPPAIKRAQHMGVQVKILTGDRPEVAGAVAREIGLINASEAVITGEQLMAMSEQEQRAAAATYHVFARVSPEQKYHIIQLLQRQYQVGFLGEGINDAPALKIADVAIVVDEASDVARSVADIILLRKSLHVIIDGIAQGRMVFANTLKYVRATLSSNLGNFYAVAFASLFIEVLPLLPVQILLINLLTDFPMIFIATDNVDTSALAKPKGYQIRDIALSAMILGLVSSVFDFMTFAAFRLASPAVLQTNWFIESVLTEIVFLFSVRTRFVFWKSAPSKPLLMMSAFMFAATLLLPLSHIGQAIFGFVPPLPAHMITIFCLVALYFIASEIVKLLFVRASTMKK